MKTRLASKWWVAFSLVAIVGHHIGPAFEGLGDTVSGTRWADWADLLVPYVLVGIAALALLSCTQRPSHKHWFIFGFGALLYTQGHGIHLAANSIGNQPLTGVARDTAHLWDEVIGHYFWYFGFDILVAAVVLFVWDKTTTPNIGRITVAILYGVMVMDTAIEGGTVPLAFATSALFIGWASVHRKGIAWDILIAYGISTALLVGWGIVYSGFPQFSELGWI